MSAFEASAVQRGAQSSSHTLQPAQPVLPETIFFFAGEEARLQGPAIAKAVEVRAAQSAI
jgi:hypothetical protein